MPRLVRIALVGLASVAAVVALVIGVAWAFLPREWVSEEAKRQAAAISGASIEWKQLKPGLEWLAIGVRIEGLAIRMPREGDPRLDLKAKEVFVRFKLLPLLSRRVEIAAARVKGAGIATWDRGPVPPQEKPAAGEGAAGGMALALPKLELDGIDIRTRDLYGGGVDLRRLHGVAEIGGTLQVPRAVRVEATVESLFWKPSARDPLLALPSPLKASIAMKGTGGAAPRLDVTRGVILLGPLKSELSGSIVLPAASAPSGAPRLDLTLTGAAQEVRSSDPAFRALAASSPATWSTKASWQIRIAGTPEAPVQTGTLTLKPVLVESGANKFSLDDVGASWSVTPDRHFTAQAQGSGSGLSLKLDAKGSTEPGGESNGTFQLDAPAARLNGLAPNTPTWKSGMLGVRAVFVSRGPAPPVVKWTLNGRDLSGTAPGIEPPIRRLQFQLAGDAERVDVRSLDATIGSTTASVTGAVTMGKPLGTGVFTAHLDRFIAEEWAPPVPAKGAAAKTAPAPAPATAAPALPFRLLTADVSIGELRQGTMTVRDLTVPVRFEAGTLTVEPIRGAIGSGTISGGLTVRNLAAKPSYALKLDVQKAPVEEFARGLIPFKLGLTGALSGAIDLAGPGFPGAAAGESLRGNLAGTVEQGKIAETETIRKLRSALGIDGNTDMAFKTITHVLRIEGGRLLLDKVRGDLGADKFELSGALGLDKSMNLGLVLRLAPERLKGSGALAEFARYSRDAEGRLPIELSIGGTTEAPKVQLKAGKFLDVAGKGLKVNLTQALSKSLAEKLAPPKKAGATDTTATSTSADSAGARPDSAAAEDPLKKSRDALRRLLGK
ncbi:MAG: AsmA-like C-terminal region-containing protein [Candidatus Eisenbacteria bacterium]